MNKGLLDRLNNVQDSRALELKDLPRLCEELRAFILNQTQTKEGHIKSSLGVTELTVLVHYLFNTPNDILIWDVGHQAYVHKVITDRKSVFSGNRVKGGISGFTNRSESPFDPFGAGHSSTSISALAGFCKADQLNKNKRERIAIIGDGALTGGMSFEALNFLGEEQADCIVILNDNASSIDQNIGALQKFGSYKAFAEALGFKFYKEEKGNNIEALHTSLQKVKAAKGPRFVHIQTQKGLGYTELEKQKSNKATFQKAFGESVLELLANNAKTVVLSPAMLSGANLTEAKKQFPNRVIDVGIAEQHCVTMAAAMAAAGFIPICHLYSTFSQRAADQIIHDVALQNLPVIFALDRAGLVGEDGATHHGFFDVSLFSAVPNLALAAPATYSDVHGMLKHFVELKQAAVIRYPKAKVMEMVTPDVLKPRWFKKGREKCIVSFGALALEAQKAVQESSYAHLNIPVLKPLPKEAELSAILNDFELIVSVEENMASGGLAMFLSQLVAHGKLNTKLKPLSLPNEFVSHASRQELLRDCGLDARGISEALN